MINSFFFCILILLLVISNIYSYVIHSNMKNPLKSFFSHYTKYNQQLLMNINKENNQNILYNSNPILSFNEPKTNVPIVIIGAMHYNPTSIQLVQDVITDLGKKDELFCTIIETCPERWNQTLQQRPYGSLLRILLNNELQTAYDITIQLFQREVILGDQNISIISSRISELFKTSIKDVLQPWKWSSIYQEIQQVLPKNNNLKSLSLPDFFSLKLLYGLPFSLLRYPLALILKYPTKFLPILAIFIALSLDFDYFDTHVNAASFFNSLSLGTVQDNPNVLNDWLESIGLTFLQLIFLSRIFLVGLLYERNIIITSNIQRKCEEAVIRKEGNKTIVVVLGMAHCNGVQDLLFRS